MLIPKTSENIFHFTYKDNLCSSILPSKKSKTESKTKKGKGRLWPVFQLNLE
jgi:hypothetical protein